MVGAVENDPRHRLYTPVTVRFAASLPCTLSLTPNSHDDNRDIGGFE
jgi:hypothetical protein